MYAATDNYYIYYLYILQSLHASSLERWGDAKQDIQLDIDCDLYPPKFKLQICPKNPSSSCGSVEVCVPFKGVTKISDSKESIVDHFIVAHSKSMYMYSIHHELVCHLGKVSSGLLGNLCHVVITTECACIIY